MNVEAPRVCPGCGNKFPDASEHCLDKQAETEASSELRTKDCVRRFGHYELLRTVHLARSSASGRAAFAALIERNLFFVLRAESEQSDSLW
jgi:hypothetical protein